jgi:hypothetical protein
VPLSSDFELRELEVATAMPYRAAESEDSPRKLIFILQFTYPWRIPYEGYQNRHCWKSESSSSTFPAQENNTVKALMAFFRLYSKTQASHSI